MSEAIGILISAEDRATAELKKAEKAFMQFEKVRSRELDYLKLQRIELEKGAEAAHSMKLQMEGLDQATADLIAREQAHINELKKLNAEQAKVSGPDGAKGTKATAEFFGAVASFAGAGEIGSVAGQIGGLTEKISQFGTVAKAGSAATMLFQGGLIAATAAISFGIGKAIGDLVFETERWNKELADSIKLQDELNAKVREFAVDQMQRQAQSIANIEDPEAQLAAIEKMTKGFDDQARSIGKNIVEMEKQKKAIDDFDEFVLGGIVTTSSQLEREEIDRNIAAQKQMLQTIRDQQIEFQKNFEEQRKARIEAEEKAKIARDQSVIQALEQELALLKANEEEARKLKAEYAGLTGEAAARAVELMKEADAEKQLKEEAKKAEEERKKAFEQEQAARKRLIDLVANENLKLQERTIALEQGAKAARIFALEQQGVAKADAERIAAREEELNRLEKEQQQKQGGPGVSQNLQATEMRLLRFGGGNEQRQIAQATQASQKHLEFIAKLAAERKAKEDREPRPAKVQDIRFREVG